MKGRGLWAGIPCKRCINILTLVVLCHSHFFKVGNADILKEKKGSQQAEEKEESIGRMKAKECCERNEEKKIVWR